MHINANSPCDMLPRSYCINAVISFCGRGMLPIGSVGIVISKSRKNLDPGKRSNRRPLRLDDSEMTVEPLCLGSRNTESLAASSWSVSLGTSLCLPHELALNGLITKNCACQLLRLPPGFFYEPHSDPDLFASLRFPRLVPKIGEVLMTSRSLKREKGWWFMHISRAWGGCGRFAPTTTTLSSRRIHRLEKREGINFYWRK